MLVNSIQVPARRDRWHPWQARRSTSLPAKPIGQDISDPNARLEGGHDNNWVLNQTSPPSLIEAAQAVDHGSGHALTV